MVQETLQKHYLNSDKAAMDANLLEEECITKASLGRADMIASSVVAWDIRYLWAFIIRRKGKRNKRVCI